MSVVFAPAFLPPASVAYVDSASGRPTVVFYRFMTALAQISEVSTPPVLSALDMQALLMTSRSH